MWAENKWEEKRGKERFNGFRNVAEYEVDVALYEH